jgi:hypothetical protein
MTPKATIIECKNVRDFVSFSTFMGVPGSGNTLKLHPAAIKPLIYLFKLLYSYRV